MRRREFITFFGGAAATWPLAARAQQPAKMKRIAIVSPATKVSEISVSGRPYYRAFFEELSRLGYVEGQNLGVGRYSGEGRTERYAELVREVVNTHPDLILAAGALLSLGFKMATTTIPIVTITADPVAIGLAASIARPGGNVTGATIDGGLGIVGKRFELLAEAMPKLSVVRYLASRPFWEGPSGAAWREAAKLAGVSLSAALLDAFNDAEYQRTFKLMEQDRAEALMVSAEPELLADRATIVELACLHRSCYCAPMIWFWAPHVGVTLGAGSREESARVQPGAGSVWVTARIRIIRHEAVPDCGSFEVLLLGRLASRAAAPRDPHQRTGAGAGQVDHGRRLP